VAAYPAAFVRSGGPDKMAVSAIGPAGADIGGTGGRPPGRQQRDPGTRWYRVRLPRADTFSTWTPGSAVVTLATSSPNGKAEFGGSTPADSLPVPARSPKYVTIRRLSNSVRNLRAGAAAANWGNPPAASPGASVLAGVSAAERVRPTIDNNLIASACREPADGLPGAVRRPRRRPRQRRARARQTAPRRARMCAFSLTFVAYLK
jgi:hypothetical protein